MPEARHRADDRSAARKGLLGALVSPILVAALRERRGRRRCGRPRVDPAVEGRDERGSDQVVDGIEAEEVHARRIRARRGDPAMRAPEPRSAA